MTIDGPLVSIVTPSLNQAGFIGATLRSVHRQDYRRLEHIVVDGGSTDGSLEILEGYRDRLTLISEPDGGQAQAINKGFERARGEIFAWLNADDLYADGAIRTVVEFFERHSDVALVYGDALAIDEHDRSYGLRRNVGAGGFRDLVEDRDFIVQPAAFWRAGLWREVGPLDDSLCYTLDYEFWMRAARKYELHYLPVCLAHERLHSSAKTFGGGVPRIDEIRRVAERHGGHGVPRAFRDEGGAMYMLRGFGRCLRGRWRDGYGDLREGSRLTRSVLKTAAFLGAALLLGPRRLARARLWSNRLRGTPV